MGVEHWVHRALGYPKLEVAGEVLVDINDRGLLGDWINRPDRSNTAPLWPEETLIYKSIVARGACDLGTVTHFLTRYLSQVVGEFPVWNRDGGTYHIDHSAVLRIAAHGIAADQLKAAAELGYEASDFTSRMFDAKGRDNVVLLSFASDMLEASYRHKGTGLELPLPLHTAIGMFDVRTLPEAHFKPEEFPRRREWLQVVHRDWEFVGPTQETPFRANVAAALDRLPADVPVLMLEIYEGAFEKDGKLDTPHPRFVAFNRWLRDIAAERPNVTSIGLDGLVEGPGDLTNRFHYNRPVYFRLYQAICDRISRR